MYEEIIDIRKNLREYVEVTQRMVDHAKVMEKNLCSGNMIECTGCPIHCSRPLIRHTKARRGPKSKN